MLLRCGFIERQGNGGRFYVTVQIFLCQHYCTSVFKPAFLSFRNVPKIAQVETGGVLLGKLLIWI